MTDQLWVLVSAALIFFMQPGFLALEAGLVRPANASITAMKCMADWMAVSVIWMLFGYALAFGDSTWGLFGASMFGGDGVDPAGGGDGWIMFLFQLGFVGTAVTIVSGAMAERVSFHTYVICSCVNGGLVYPLVAHWIWGGAVTGDPTFLHDLGFRDFAGSTAVHSVGGWLSLVGIWMLGPRLGRFDADGNPRPVASYNIPLAATGVFVLWFGWWGFNGGSTLALAPSTGNSAALVIANTNLAGATAGLVAWAHARFAPPHRDVQNKFIGGALAGLVAITACSNVVSPTSAMAIGLLAGLVHNFGYEALLRLRLDDPVGAVPVHLGGGVLGTLCVGLFGDPELGVPRSFPAQLGVQALGVVVVGALCVAVAFATLTLLRHTIGLRVAPRDERDGLSLERPAAPPTIAAALDEAELRRRMMGEE